MQTLSNVSPFKWGVLAFEGTIWRGMSMQELMLPFAVLIGFAIVGFAIGALGIRRVMDGEK
jgi:ABC-2 type transport system permease protein